MQNDRSVRGGTSGQAGVREPRPGEAAFHASPGAASDVVPGDTGSNPYTTSADGSLPAGVEAETTERGSLGRGAWLIALAVLAAAALPTALFSDYHLFQLTMVVVYAIAILGLSLLTGF